MSVREWRAVREGEAHAAARTYVNNTRESFIVGIGASGALLASAAIVFVTLVGLVSFNVWPTGHAVSVDRSTELSPATPNVPSAGAPAPANATGGQVASAPVQVGTPGVGANTGGGNTQNGGAKGAKPKGSVIVPPTTTPPSTPGSGDTGVTSGSGSAPGTASKSPVHPVHPTHPETPHQNVSDPVLGKDDPSDGGFDDVVHGKAPFSRPDPPSISVTTTTTVTTTSSDSGTTGNGRGHGSPSSRH